MIDKIINRKKYRIYKPFNSWDMNYHFIDKNGIDYLIDLTDVMEYNDTEYGNIELAVKMVKDLGIDGASWTSRQ